MYFQPHLFFGSRSKFRSSIFVLCFLLISGSSFGQSINQYVIDAAAEGDVDMLNKLLQSDSIICDFRGTDGASALDVAIEQNKKEAFIRLVDYYNSKCSNQYTIVNQDPQVSVTSRLIMRAVLDNDTFLLEKVLSLKANPSLMHCSGFYPLTVASRWGFFRTAELLIEHGSDVNEVNKNRFHTSPLMEAVRSGNMEIGKLLLDKGALVNKTDLQKNTALNWAVKYNQIAFVQLLLDHGASVTMKEKVSGEDAIHIAQRLKFTEIEKLLIQNKK
ncbi:hypothetical protein BH11BAC2_BH11BAC2_07760 [soil metagenome]